MLKDWNFWFSVITAAIAIVALLQTKQQSRLSNKQHLFDKRVEHYLVAKGLIQLYESNSDHLIFQESEPVLAMNLIFTWMTNNTYLEKIADAIGHPLEEPYHKEFLIKIEVIKEVSSKIVFEFAGKASGLLGNFVWCYQELLFRMYQYQIMLNDMTKYAQKFGWTLEKAQESVGENRYRAELQEAVDKLEQAYELLKKENVEQKIEKQIKLR